MLKRNLVVLLILLVLAGAGCQKKGSVLFEPLATSNFGLEIAFGMSAEEVHAKLGDPVAKVERQGGNNVEEFYLSEKDITTSYDTPQLSLTYHNNELVRLHNHYYPADDQKPLPPFFMEVIPGVKLGNRRSAFVDALGARIEDPLGDTWRFESADGRSITIKADFTDVTETGDALCSRLQVVITQALAPQRGEEYE